MPRAPRLRAGAAVYVVGAGGVVTTWTYVRMVRSRGRVLWRCRPPWGDTLALPPRRWFTCLEDAENRGRAVRAEWVAYCLAEGIDPDG